MSEEIQEKVSESNLLPKKEDSEASAFKKKIGGLSGEFVMAIACYLAVISALTWPTILHLDSVLLGGGELGGWLWRNWWHFEEVKSIQETDMGALSSLEALISLGRFPETGNILDILLFSYPLRNWFGFPADHNLKVIIILLGNGLCGYALARSFTDSRLVSLSAGMIAIINPLVIQDINKLGLRQVTLWWLLLFPIFLQRAGRTTTIKDGISVGVCFTLISAFYWFYGLFAAMFGAIWLIWWLIAERPPWRIAIRWLSSAACTALIGVFFFLLPYFSAGDEQASHGGGGGGSNQLPEVTFFLPYPSYDTVSAAPERPTNYQENVLSSLHRGIDSAWPADFIIDPRHGVLAFPVVVFLFAIIPAFFVRRARIWLCVWIVFWLGTMGPFLKIGAQKDTADVVMLGDYVVRMPYCLMFQFIPGMSRMFAPYRLSSMVVVMAVILTAIVLDLLQKRRRRVAAIIFGMAVVAQPFYRFDLETIDEFEARPSMWRIPTQTSAMRLPSWYKSLDPEGWEGLIELPLEQQQDLLCAYQSFHHRKVYRSWATTSAVPPFLRSGEGGDYGKRLRWLAKEPPRKDRMEELFRNLSRNPDEVDIGSLSEEGLLELMESGSYRWLVLHERGYYLVNPNKGDVIYRDLVRKLEELLGVTPKEIVEQKAFDWPGKRRHFPVGPAWIPWASQEVQKPIQDMPDRYFMAIFDLYEWKDTRESIE